MRVLVAEDDFWVAMLIESVVLAGGHDAVAVRSYGEAKEAVLADPPDMAIVDLRLVDGLTGPALARALVWAGIPTVVCSGNPAARLFLDGTPVLAVLNKPVDTQDLRRTFQKVHDFAVAG